MVFKELKKSQHPPQPTNKATRSCSSSAGSDLHLSHEHDDVPQQVQIHVGAESIFVTHTGTILSHEPSSLLARDLRKRLLSTSNRPSQIVLQFPNRNSGAFMHIISYLRTGHPELHKLDDAGLDLLEKEAVFYELWGLKERTNMERERRKKAQADSSNPQDKTNRKKDKKLVEEDAWVDDALLHCCRDTLADRLPVPDDDLVFEMAL